MFHWQFLITYISSVSLKFQACYITGQWGQFKVKIRMLLSESKFLFFLWQSIKFLQQNINHSSETGNITASITVNELFQKATYRWGGGGEGVVAEGMEFLNKMWKFQGPRKGIYQGSRNNHVEFPWVFNIGIGISKECSTSFRNSKGEASFCLEFLGVK